MHQSIRTILKSAREEAFLVAVSSLAEGADRIFASEALALDCPLICPLPFPQGEFEQDFVPPAALEPDSLSHFRALLQQARSGPGLTLLELSGLRADASAAYEAAAHMMLDQSQLLIAVWDGGKSAGRGGTVETLRVALGRGLPVLWLQAQAPQNWALLAAEADLAGVHPAPAPGLAQCVSALVQRRR